MVQSGSAAPLGATVVDGGVNFSLYSHHADAVELVLFDEGSSDPSATIALDPTTQRTDNYWHVFVPGLWRRPALRLPGRSARTSPPTGCASIPASSCSTPTPEP